MISLEEKNLRLAFLPLPKPVAGHLDRYKQALATWEESWLQHFGEYKVEQPLYLDGFLRQDEAACIFTPTQCVGMILFRSIDFGLLNYRRDSYFKDWTDQDLEVLLKHGNKVFAATFLTVHQDFRKFSPDFKFKEIFMNVMIKRFMESGCDVISGIARKDRGLNDESFKLGARLVHEDVVFLGGRTKVDLVCFYRHEARENPNAKVCAVADRLWAERLELGHSPLIKKAG